MASFCTLFRGLPLPGGHVGLKTAIDVRPIREGDDTNSTRRRHQEEAHDHLQEVVQGLPEAAFIHLENPSNNQVFQVLGTLVLAPMADSTA